MVLGRIFQSLINERQNPVFFLGELISLIIMGEQEPALAVSPIVSGMIEADPGGYVKA